MSKSESVGTEIGNVFQCKPSITGPSIFMVMGGFNGTALSTVDAIDLSGQERSCVQPNQLPFSMEDAMAFTGWQILSS